MSAVFRTSWEGSTMLDLLRSSAGDLGPAHSDPQRRAAALPHNSQGLAPTLLCFLLAFKCGCGLPEEPVLVCGGKVLPPSWGCRGKSRS